MDASAGVGRLGSPGRVVIEPFPDEDQALNAGRKIEAARRRRRYQDQPDRFQVRAVQVPT
jgi:predicted DNA-binding WGR domain protein